MTTQLDTPTMACARRYALTAALLVGALAACPATAWAQTVDGLELEDGDVLVNNVTIDGGADLLAGVVGHNVASITNNEGASIYGAIGGIWIDGTLGSLHNYGDIAGGLAGANFTGYVGEIYNAGTIIAADGSTSIWNNDGIGLFENASSGVLNSIRVFAGKVGTFINHGLIEPTLPPEWSIETLMLRGGVDSLVNTGRIVGTPISYAVQFGAEGMATPLGTVTNTGTIVAPHVAIAIVGGAETPYHIVNSGTIAGGTYAIADFGYFHERYDPGGPLYEPLYANDGMLTLLTGSRIEGAIRLGGGHSIIDFSAFEGNALLHVESLDEIVAGSRLYFWDDADFGRDGVGELAIVSADGFVAAPALTSDLAQQIAGIARDQLRAAGRNGPTPQAGEPLAYAAAPPPFPAFAADSVFPDDAFWATGFGGASGDGHASTSFGGLLAGGHAGLDGNTRLGLLAGYGKGIVEAGAGSHTLSSDLLVAGLYGDADIGAVALDFSLLTGLGLMQSTRIVSGPGGDVAARGEAGLFFAAPALGASMALVETEHAALRIRGQLAAVGGVQAGYAESGTALGVTVGEQGFAGLESRLELAAAATIGEALLSGRAGLFHQADLGPGSFDMTALGLTQQVVAGSSDGVGAYLGVGLDLPLATGADLSGGAELSLRDDGRLAGAGRIALVGRY